MIPKPVLKSLITRRIEDSKVLLNNHRYPATVYMSGYALELALKYRISSLMKLNAGFPENKTEFNLYHTDTKKVTLRNNINELRDIRHHKLAVLLRYSGEQVNIETHFGTAWDFVKDWSPEMRYSNSIVRKQKAEDFLKYVRIIVNEIM